MLKAGGEYAQRVQSGKDRTVTARQKRSEASASARGSEAENAGKRPRVPGVPEAPTHKRASEECDTEKTKYMRPAEEIGRKRERQEQKGEDGNPSKYQCEEGDEIMSDEFEQEQRKVQSADHLDLAFFEYLNEVYYDDMSGKRLQEKLVREARQEEMGGGDRQASGVQEGAGD